MNPTGLVFGGFILYLLTRGRFNKYVALIKS